MLIHIEPSNWPNQQLQLYAFYGRKAKMRGRGGEVLKRQLGKQSESKRTLRVPI